MGLWRIRPWAPELPSREMIKCKEPGGGWSDCVCVCVCLLGTEDRKTIVDSGVLGESGLERDN